MDKDSDIRINRLAQGLESIEAGLIWFRNLGSAKQGEVLRTIASFITQAGAREEDVPTAIERSSLRATYTPIVLLSRGSLKMQLPKVVNLPLEEREKAFRLLIALLAIADERRRRTTCANGCSHWWHQDLGGAASSSLLSHKAP